MRRVSVCALRAICTQRSSRALVVAALAAILACGTVLFQVGPIQAQNQSPSVGIVPKPKRGILTKPVNPGAGSPAAEAPVVGSPPVSAKYLQAMLDAHNAYRTKHCVPGLTWSAQLAAAAQAWANGCKIAYSSRGGVAGETIAWSTRLFTAKEAVDIWYNQIQNYNFDSPGFSSKAGDFTQLVWRGTQQLGCGVAFCPGAYGKGYFWVCQYSPPGNVVGEKSFVENVPRPCS